MESFLCKSILFFKIFKFFFFLFGGEAITYVFAHNQIPFSPPFLIHPHCPSSSLIRCFILILILFLSIQSTLLNPIIRNICINYFSWGFIILIVLYTWAAVTLLSPYHSFCKISGKLCERQTDTKHALLLILALWFQQFCVFSRHSARMANLHF